MWGADYQSTLQSELNNGTAILDANNLARDYADRNRLDGSSQAFADLKNTIININNWDHVANVRGAPATGGAALWQRSRMYHNEIQYDLTSLTKKYVDVLVGADARVFEVLPDGNNFVDFTRPINERNKPGGNNVFYSKVGGFAQFTKKIYKDKLKFVGSLRYDKNFEFEGRWNPRFAIVYSPVEQHNFRISVQNGYRFPSLFEALSYVNNGNVRRVGGLQGVNEGLGYLENSYTLNSVNAYTSAVNTDVANGINRTQAGLARQNILQQTALRSTQPEEIKSLEFGYKSVMFKNSFVIDLDLYLNQYTGFLGQVEVAVPSSGLAGTNEASLDMLTRANQTRYRVYTNARNIYYNYGSGLRLSYHFPSKWNISGNFNYNALVSNKSQDIFITGFNTPKYAGNISVGNREIARNLGFNVVAKWQDSFLWESPLANGTVPSFWTLDAQATYKIPKYFASIKVGASNLLNNRYIQYAAGPTIGALYYVSITFDGLFSDLGNKKNKP